MRLDEVVNFKNKWFRRKSWYKHQRIRVAQNEIFGTQFACLDVPNFNLNKFERTIDLSYQDIFADDWEFYE